MLGCSGGAGVLLALIVERFEGAGELGHLILETLDGGSQRLRLLGDGLGDDQAERLGIDGSIYWHHVDDLLGGLKGREGDAPGGAVWPRRLKRRQFPRLNPTAQGLIADAQVLSRFVNGERRIGQVSRGGVHGVSLP